MTTPKRGYHYTPICRVPHGLVIPPIDIKNKPCAAYKSGVTVVLVPHLFLLSF